MRKLITALAIAQLCLTSAFAAPAKNHDRMESALQSYLVIQDALASDTLEHVKGAAESIARETTEKGLKQAAGALTQAKTLDTARTEFRKLSAIMVDWAKSAKPAGVDRMFCSMANAPWLQKHGEPRNPYYGRSMLKCGEAQK